MASYYGSVRGGALIEFALAYPRVRTLTHIEPEAYWILVTEDAFATLFELAALAPSKERPAAIRIGSAWRSTG